MMEEKPIHQQAFPEPAVGVVIYNDKGEILLVQGPKFADYWNLVGGHIEVGETAEDALHREVNEEVGLHVDTVEFLYWADAINPEFFHKKIHFLFLDFAARYASGEIKLNQEISGYKWIQPTEALQTLKLNSFTRKAVEKSIARNEETNLLSKCEEYKAGWQRAVADYQNLQKEVRERRQEWAEMSEQQILEEFLPVYDNLKKAFAHHPTLTETDETHKKIQNWINGIGHIMRQFNEVMRQHKIEEIKTVDEKFDPKFHEAVGEAHEPEPNGSVQGSVESGTIVREIDGGYVMGGRVIKVAKVVIAK